MKFLCRYDRSQQERTSAHVTASEKLDGEKEPTPSERKCGGSGAEEQRHTAHDRREETRVLLAAGVPHHLLHRLPSLIPDQIPKLFKDLPLSRLLTEHHSREANGDDQQRGEGKHRVVGQRSAQCRRVVVHPLDGGLLR